MFRWSLSSTGYGTEVGTDGNAERLNGEFTGLARIEAIRCDTSFYGAQFHNEHVEFQPSK